LEINFVPQFSQNEVPVNNTNNIGYKEEGANLQGKDFAPVFITWGINTGICIQCVVPENIHTPTTEGISLSTPLFPGFSVFGSKL